MPDQTTSQKPATFALWLLFAAGVAPYYLNDIYNPVIKGILPAYWVMEVFIWVVMPCFIFDFAMIRKWLRPVDLGLHGRLFGKEASISRFLAAALLVLVMVVGFRAIDWEIAKQYSVVSIKGGLSDQADAIVEIKPAPSPSAPPSIPSSRTETPISTTSVTDAKSAYTIDAGVDAEVINISAPRPDEVKVAPGIPMKKPMRASEIPPLYLLVQAIFWSLTAGIIEELYFRGWLRRLLQGSILRNLAFVLLSTASFSLIHWGQGEKQIIATAVFGLMASSAYLWIRNLWPIIIAHTIINVTFFWQP